VLAAPLGALHAQGGASRAPVPAAQAQVKPDEEAYQQASKIKDPQERVRALLKLLAEFPDSTAVFPAASEVKKLSIDAVVKATSDFVAAQNARLSRAKDAAGRCWEDFFAAGELLRRETLLDFAEKYARNGLAYWTVPGRDDPKMTANNSDFYLKEVDLRGLLGQILFKQGRRDEAEPLLRQAYAGRPSDLGMTTMSLPYLADIARERGRDAEALEFMTDMVFNGMLTPERREQLHALYRKTHEGSLDGLEQMLDARYEATRPKVPITPYRPGPARTGRAVLAEVFTGAGCGSCAGVDLAFDAVLERYERQDVIVMMHHVHIPSPDPLANRVTEARQKFYRVDSAPHYMIDGLEPPVSMFEGGGPPDKAETILSKGIEPWLQRELVVPPDARLSLRVTSKEDRVATAATVDRIKTASKTLRLHVALVENHVRYSGTNGVRFHSVVVRDMAGDRAQGFSVDPRAKATVRHVFDLQKVSADLKAYLDDYAARQPASLDVLAADAYQVDRTRLAVVAFVQDEVSRRVLQAVYAPVKLK